METWKCGKQLIRLHKIYSHKRGFHSRTSIHATVSVYFLPWHITAYDIKLTCCLSRLVLSALALRNSLLMWSSCRSRVTQRDSAAARLVINTVDQTKRYRNKIQRGRNISNMSYYMLCSHSPWLQSVWPPFPLSVSAWPFKCLCVTWLLCRCVRDASFPMERRLSCACPFSNSSLLIFSWRFLKADRIATHAHTHADGYKNVMQMEIYWKIAFNIFTLWLQS